MSISWLFVGEVKGKGVICFGLTEDEADEIDDDSVEADVNAMFSDINPHGIIEVLKARCASTPVLTACRYGTGLCRSSGDVLPRSRSRIGVGIS